MHMHMIIDKPGISKRITQIKKKNENLQIQFTVNTAEVSVSSILSPSLESYPSMENKAQ